MGAREHKAQEISCRESAPCAEGAFDPLAGLSLKDDRLRAALEGRAYLVFDGAMGTMLQSRGLEAGELPELLNLAHPDEVTAIHRAYVEAGSDVVTTNTFGANARKLGDAASVDEVFAAAIQAARASGARYVAADIGPTGALLEPLGTLSFEEAYGLFKEQVVAAEHHGADLVLVETMADLLEAKAAVLAARENTNLPVFATMTFGEDGRTFLGTTPEIAATVLSGLGVQAVGINCSLGPDALAPLIERMAPFARCPLMVQANAGLPQIVEGRTVYGITPEDYAASVACMVEAGVSVIGGCCGTNPDYIRLLARLVEGRTPGARTAADALTVASSQRLVELACCRNDVAVIGERINPTGKKRLKEALRAGDYDCLIGEAVSQQEAGADILDVNVGLPELDEPVVLAEAVRRISAITPLPLQVDSSDVAAVEAAVRTYAGKPLINSVNGKRESLGTVLPVAKKYGCAVVGLTLDEDGIPSTAEGRYAIAERIVAEAERRGIPRCDVAIDCLVMAASTNQKEAREILRAVSLVKERLGVKTVLGVSNVSFGLPQRELVNATFLAAAFGAGLDLPILNPLSQRYMDTVSAYRVLNAQDEGAAGFIEAYAVWNDPYKAGAAGVSATGGSQGVTARDSGASAAVDDAKGAEEDDRSAEARARHAILTGRKADMTVLTEELLSQREPLSVINEVFIPVLDEVGAKFESGAFFLPQLMASAEAVKVGFDVVKHASTSGAAVAGKGTVALATVKGDIHDIGKNSVKMLLENYGYEVVDLGRDVDPQKVVDTVRERDIKLVGLSALMTTTVRGMEETIALLRQEVPDVTVFVGGAVLTPEYARMVGADYYAKDAAESARLAGEFFSGTA